MILKFFMKYVVEESQWLSCNFWNPAKFSLTFEDIELNPINVSIKL